MTIRFAVIGINHDHINGQVGCLLAEGAEFAGFCAAEDDLAAPFAARYGQARRVDDPRWILDDPSIDLVVSAAVPADRAAIAESAMRAGKDVMLDKPGMTTMDQLETLRRTQRETGRILSILYSEHFENRATVKAGELVRAGAIGQVVSTAGFGPHRMRPAGRPGWFFQRERYGGILVDIASHQFEQFLFFADAEEAEILSARVANRGHREHPGVQDTGDAHLATRDVNGFIRVDWFTPEGLPVWGDGRLFITGTEGMIELRKYVDVAGRPGGDHLFLTDAKGVRHVDCSAEPLPYGRQLIADIRDRTETAMPQARCFKAMELALRAQAMAEGARA
ncbi:Gfo/Idh/MocA family protein [Aureimonas jatrophae]|uniref:Predicted dehydrogenase n=1 Tax=Aureimonas jatrophae TaxID=1166073 RepID=A0A1H0F4C7_9HYPH|nr:Gfo/Idh/MocA family oxidoreductase [Aureimonas jatrophae]MBB3950185.1 putative dehydrogenase [Aureimonas jatrophae]SDN89510.1 Predicted dehydrogenase [Aureimonas jatrophae]